MKTLAIALGLMLSAQSFAAGIDLICNDQNGHAVYKLQLSNELTDAQLITLLGDSSVLSSGTKTLSFQEGESSPTYATYAGKTNSGLNIALSLNAEAALNLRKFDVLDVDVHFQATKGGNLSGKTLLLCSKNL